MLALLEAVAEEKQQKQQEKQQKKKLADENAPAERKHENDDEK